MTSKNSEYGEDPPYTYTTTVYFDNTFPSANVYVTINYNTNQAGEIIAAEVTSGSYGTFFGNTYTQTNVNATLQNGIFVFRITGQFTTSVGVGSFSLTGTNTAYYTGQFNLWRGNAGGSSGWVKQEAQNTKAPVPSEAAYTRMTERDENSINHNGGKIVRYDSEGRVYSDYSEGNTVQK